MPVFSTFLGSINCPHFWKFLTKGIVKKIRHHLCRFSNHWNIFFSFRLLWSDECQIKLYGHNDAQYVRRPIGKRMVWQYRLWSYKLGYQNSKHFLIRVKFFKGFFDLFWNGWWRAYKICVHLSTNKSFQDTNNENLNFN